MHWTDEVAETLKNYRLPANSGGVHLINDSKTPSGRAHVGALRGVLIHDAMERALKERGVKVKYRFGCDDFDPNDSLPFGMEEFYTPHLGKPLCNCPPPPPHAWPGFGPRDATDMADFYIRDFWSVFKDLGVECEFYRMRDVYRNGTFNEPIDRILSQAPRVREIYKEVSNSDRAAGWLPFQTICENCGRVGTTECTNYDGKTVEYFCKPNLVEWAKGCGHRGKMSPFSGNGKLPWKLEWVAKWATFPVTIEGAGEDHNTKGGSRDVAAHCLRAIYGREAPQNIPYSFVLVGGKKMSSSKGLGVSAREVADFLPPEILRYLMLRTKPLSQTNFEPTEEALVKVFNEYDRAHAKTFAVPPDAKFPVHERKNYTLSVVHPSGYPGSPNRADGSQTRLGEPGYPEPTFDCEFQLVLALVQMPHLDIVAEFARIKGSDLSGLERKHLDRRIHAARYFIANLASPEERLTLQTSPPAKASELTPVQRGFLHALAGNLRTCEWNGEALQAAVFDAARATPIDQPSAFLAFYRVLLDNTKGPKAGNFLAFLKREDLVRLFWAVPLDEAEYLRAAASSIEDVRKFAQDGKVKAMHATLTTRSAGAAMFVEARVTTDDSKTHVRRVLVDSSAEETIRALRKVLPLQIA